MPSMIDDLKIGRSMTTLALLLLAMGLGMPSMPGLHAQSGGAGPLPCNPRFTRTMAPLAVEQGDEAEVELRIEYDCPRREITPRVNVLLVIGTAVTADTRSRVGFERNLRSALSTMINSIPFENGSKGGLVAFDDEARLLVALGPDRLPLLQAADRIRVRGGVSGAGFDDAIILAEQQLRANPDGGIDILIVLDTGAPGMTSDAFCALTDIDVHLIQLAVAGGRLLPCVRTGVRTLPNSGDGMEEVFESLADRLFRGETIEGIRVIDAMKPAYVDYVPGSSNIGEPARRANNRYEWILPVDSNPRADWSMSYRVRFSEEDPQLAPDRLQVSEWAEAVVSYGGGRQFTIDLHRPQICLARPGRLAEDCAGYQTPTPTASTPPDRPTDEPVPSPTGGPTTATPMASDTPGPASPTATTDELRGSVYLPLLLADEAELAP